MKLDRDERKCGLEEPHLKTLSPSLFLCVSALCGSFVFVAFMQDSLFAAVRNMPRPATTIAGPR